MTEAQRLKVSLAQLWGAFEEDIEVEVLECLLSAEKLEHDEMQRQVSPLLAPRASRFAFRVSGFGWGVEGSGLQHRCDGQGLQQG